MHYPKQRLRVFIPCKFLALYKAGYNVALPGSKGGG